MKVLPFPATRCSGTALSRHIAAPPSPNRSDESAAVRLAIHAIVSASLRAAYSRESDTDTDDAGNQPQYAGGDKPCCRGTTTGERGDS